MRLLHVIASVDPAGGGPIEGIVQQAAIRHAQQWEVHVATLDSPSAPCVKACPLTVHALGADKKPTGWRRRLPWVHYGYSPKFVPWLRLHAPSYHMVVVEGLWNYAAYGSKKALAGSGLPYVVFTHGMLDPWFKQTYPLKALLKQVFWWLCEGPLLNNARLVLFTTEEEKLLAREGFRPYHPRERVVGYGTSDIAIDSERQQTAFRELLPQLGGRPYLLFLSRIHPKKGCDLLIEAFAAIAKDHPEIDLVMAGPDQMNWRRSLEQRATALGVAQRIFWPGMLSGDAKWGAFLGAEAFVLPSHQENFGIVVAEAMAAGKPVLITDKINIWREVEAVGGGLVETDQQASITRLLTRFLDLTPTEKAEMGQRARQGFLDHFEIHKAVDRIDDALQDAMAMTA